MNQSPFDPGSRVCAYLRDSGGDDQDLSTEQQEHAIKQWCINNQLVLTRVFVDQASPGSSTVGRKQFHEMIAYFRHEPPEHGLVIWKYSRFARNIDDAQYYRTTLRREGYEIHSLNDNIPVGRDGRFLETAIDWANEKFLEDLSEDVKRGLRHIMQNHGAIGGTPPRGFKREPLELGVRRDGSPHIVHRWVPDHQLWDRCRLAWNMRLSGASYQEIHKATGIYRSIAGYKGFFKNPLYKGEMHFGKKDDKIIIEDYAPPLVTKEEWDTVQKMNTKNANIARQFTSGNNPTHPRRKNSTYILSGILTCAVCGSSMNGKSVKFKNSKKTWRYYQCGEVKRKGDCHAANIPAKTIEKTVINSIKTELLSPDNIQTMLKTIKQAEEQQTITTPDIDQYRKQLAQTRNRINNLTNAISEEKNPPRAVLRRIQEEEKEEIRLLSEIERIKSKENINTDEITIETLFAAANAMKKALDTDDKETLKNILRGFIKNILAERVDDKIYIMIDYYFPPGNDDLNKNDADTNNPFMPTSGCPQGDTSYRHKYYIITKCPHRTHQFSPQDN